MSFASLKSEIANLPLEQRRELMGYIAALNRNDNGEFLRKLAVKIDDKSPERWLTIEEVEKRLK
ncbi:hypothetical protein [Roseimicrobium gellanilyticum]|nr:hypothetical protein [Roseimicrobium gellanilyticum]